MDKKELIVLFSYKKNTKKWRCKNIKIYVKKSFKVNNTTTYDLALKLKYIFKLDDINIDAVIEV